MSFREKPKLNKPRLGRKCPHCLNWFLGDDDEETSRILFRHIRKKHPEHYHPPPFI